MVYSNIYFIYVLTSSIKLKHVYLTFKCAYSCKINTLEDSKKSYLVK